MAVPQIAAAQVVLPGMSGAEARDALSRHFTESRGSRTSTPKVTAPRAGDNRVRVYQDGDNNAAAVHQSGQGNRVFLRQAGEGHDASILQSGKYNDIVVIQMGNNTTLTAEQLGNGNRRKVLLIGR